MTDLVVVQRLLIASALAGAIGYERERHGRAAGFRTHILVGVGSCVVMLTGLYLLDALEGRVDVDPTRMASQVVSGIGFLGAGTILRFRASVRGLTTAASLWAVAGVGLAVGAGFLVGAGVASGIVLVALFGFAPLERRMRKTVYRTLAIESRAPGANLGKIRRVLGEHDVEIRDFDVRPTETPEGARLELQVKLPSGSVGDELIQSLLLVEGTQRAYWI